MTDLLERPLELELEPLPRWELLDDREVGLLRRVRLETWVTLIVVIGSVVFTVGQLHPDLVLSNTTPTGGDFGAHVWGPAYLRDHLLPKFRLTGWAPDWYAGFPMYTFYMVVPALAVVAVNLVAPYGVALKMVSLLGIATLPIAAATLAAAAGLAFPYPALFAMAATWFLFDESFSIYGGNIASTMAGEFSFSIALSLAVFALAALIHGLRTGRHRAGTAALFALCALCHLIVCFFAVIGAVLLFCVFADRQRLRYLLTVGGVAGLVTSFWMLPFYAGRNYMTDMGYERRPVGNAPNGLHDSNWQMIFPQGIWADRVIMALAIIGLIGSLARARRLGVWLGVMSLGYGAWALLWPENHLWNARLLPFMYLTRYLLAALGVGELIVLLGAVPGRVGQWPRRVTQVALVSGCVAALIVMFGMSFRWLPFGETRSAKVGGKTVSQYVWGPFHSNHRAFVDGWARWNFTGYEGKPAYGEYRNLMETMTRVGNTSGCGRAEWEYTKDENRYGTTMSLMLLPYWTDGCVASMEGLFFEASATTPYHFMTASALSAAPSNPVRHLPYSSLDVDKGTKEMQLLGVRYYLAFSPEAVRQAQAQPNLREIATSGPWHVFQVAGSDVVTALQYQPAVVRSVAGRDQWNNVAVKYFTTPASWPVALAASGPAAWERVDAVASPGPKSKTLGTVDISPTPKQVELPAVTVSNVVQGDDGISFDVDKVGVPVLVKVSYYPNWTVAGGQGPYRVAPNQMVVIPTAKHVRLHYSRSHLEIAATGLSVVGLAALVALGRSAPVAYSDRPVRPRRRRRKSAADWTLPEPGDVWLFEWEDDLTQLAWVEPVRLEDWAPATPAASEPSPSRDLDATGPLA